MLPVSSKEKKIQINNYNKRRLVNTQSAFFLCKGRDNYDYDKRTAEKQNGKFGL